MNAKRASRIIALVTPSLRPGEEVEIVGRARISSAPVALVPPPVESVPAAVACAHPALLSSTAVIADGRPRAFYVVMTGHRLIMVRRNRIAGQVLRDCVVGVTDVRTALHLAVAGRDRGLRIALCRGSRQMAVHLADLAVRLEHATLSAASERGGRH